MNWTSKKPIPFEEAANVPPEEWCDTANAWRDHPRGSLEWCAFTLGANLCCIVGEQDKHRAIVMECARKWHAKFQAGVKSCVWHEFAIHFNQLDSCQCFDCREARKKGKAA